MKKRLAEKADQNIKDKMIKTTKVVGEVIKKLKKVAEKAYMQDVYKNPNDPVSKAFFEKALNLRHVIETVFNKEIDGITADAFLRLEEERLAKEKEQQQKELVEDRLREVFREFKDTKRVYFLLQNYSIDTIPQDKLNELLQHLVDSYNVRYKTAKHIIEQSSLQQDDMPDDIQKKRAEFMRIYDDVMWVSEEKHLTGKARVVKHLKNKHTQKDPYSNKIVTVGPKTEKNIEGVKIE